MTVAQHAQVAKSASAAIARPGAKAGQASEFTLISKLKPGAAERVRALLADGFTGERQKNTDRIATVHDLRFVIFDNDTAFLDPPYNVRIGGHAVSAGSHREFAMASGEMSEVEFRSFLTDTLGAAAR